MRVLKDENITPIYMLPGDSVEVSYTDPHGKTTKVVSHVVTERRDFDYAAIVELDTELDGLGLQDGMAGVIGRRFPKP